MTRTTLMNQLSATRFVSALAAFSVVCTASHGATVVSENYESYSLGAFGTVSDFSDATYMGANGVASVVAGQALQFAFDVKTGMGALNTNVSAPFPAAATNNSSTNLANYTLEFDLSLLSGINTGWFGVCEVVAGGSGPRTQDLNLGALTVGGPAVHHSMTLAAMAQPFGSVINPTSTNWDVHLVALGFPANAGGGTVRTTLLLDNVKVTVVPEPSSLLLGIAMIVGLTRSRRQSRRNSWQ